MATTYQTAYSAKRNAVFVTSAVGRPPVRQSELLRLNGDTLAVQARITPAAAPGRTNTGLWVTQTVSWASSTPTP